MPTNHPDAYLFTAAVLTATDSARITRVFAYYDVDRFNAPAICNSLARDPPRYSRTELAILKAAGRDLLYRGSHWSPDRHRERLDDLCRAWAGEGGDDCEAHHAPRLLCAGCNPRRRGRVGRPLSPRQPGDWDRGTGPSDRTFQPPAPHRPLWAETPELGQWKPRPTRRCPTPSAGVRPEDPEPAASRSFPLARP